MEAIATRVEAITTSNKKLLVASLLLVVRPGAPSSVFLCLGVSEARGGASLGHAGEADRWLWATLGTAFGAAAQLDRSEEPWAPEVRSPSGCLVSTSFR